MDGKILSGLLTLVIILSLLLCVSCTGQSQSANPTAPGTTVNSQPTSTKEFPTEILSPNDSLELVSVTPVCGTILRSGTNVQFTVTLNYKLNSYKSAFIRTALGLESCASIDISPFVLYPSDGYIKIQKGSGTVVAEGSVNVGILIQMLQSDKVYLTIELLYLESQTQQIIIVRRVLKDCYFTVESSPP